MSPRQLALTVLVSVAVISGPTCTPVLESSGGGGDLQCIQRTERSMKGLYSSVDQLPEVDRLVLMFANPADRDQTIEQDLRFVKTLDTWAVYQITGPTPRIYMPGIIDTDGDRYGLTSQVCPGTVFGEFPGANTVFMDQRVNGIWLGETEPRVLMDRPINTREWHGDFICDNGYDWLGGNSVPDGRVDYTYIDWDPPPPVGSYFTIQMVNFGPYGVPGPDVHGDGAGTVCCTEQNGCCLYDDAGCPPVQYPYCGDRNVDPGEECDDGGNVSGDGCDANCQFDPYCGDGTRDAGEVCDDGANNGTVGYCNANCTGPEEPPGGGAYCGDGHTDAGEICDDGANNGTVGYCKADCTGLEEPPGGGAYCGDGIVNGDEECDDGDNNGQAGFCAEDCTRPVEPPGPGDLPYCDELVS